MNDLQYFLVAMMISRKSKLFMLQKRANKRNLKKASFWFSLLASIYAIVRLTSAYNN
jgi:hypothetical protein